MGPEGSPPESPPSGGFWPTVHRVEDAALTVLVILLVLIAGGQIVLRAAFHWGVDWTDPMLRSLVLWVAMFGAMIAAREDKHLGVDAVPRLLSGLSLVLARLLAQGFAAAVCAALAWYSVGLVQLERESQTIAFAQVPTWVTQLAMPFGFTVMGLRFALRALGIGKLGGANTP
jgi:TRAP-type C4-dicarboxylate transport system permease small subunit